MVLEVEEIPCPQEMESARNGCRGSLNQVPSLIEDPEQRHDDVLRLIQLVLSSKSKEVMQKEVMQYLMFNQDLLLTYLSRISDGHLKWANNWQMNALGQCAKQTVKERCEGVRNEKSACTVTHAPVSCNEVAGHLTDGKPDRKETESKPPENSCPDSPDDGNDSKEVGNESPPKKRRKSKYDYIQGDLSHIRREPKCSKGNPTSEQKKTSAKKNGKKREKSQKQRTDEKHEVFKEMKYEEVSNAVNDIPVTKTEDADEKVRLVHSMMETLIHPPSKQHQENVVSILRSDATLRELFMREKAAMRNLKIPVFNNSVGQNTNGVQGYSTVTSMTQAYVDENICSPEARLQDFSTERHTIGNILQSLSGAVETNQNMEHVAGVTPSVQKYRHCYTAGPSQITSPSSSHEPISPAVSYFSPSNSNEESLQILDNTSTTCPLIGSKNVGSEEMHILEGTLLDSNATIFDVALHEHFQDLSRDQFTINNTFMTEANMVTAEKE